jgi:hypothetical protein
MRQQDTFDMKAPLDGTIASGSRSLAAALICSICVGWAAYVVYDSRPVDTSYQPMQQQIESSPRLSAMAHTAAEVQQSFERFVGRSEARLVPVFQSSKDVDLKNVGYDILKTNSLVSPFTAHIQLELLFGAGPNNPVKKELTWRYDFAFQDNAWVFKSDEVTETSEGLNMPPGRAGEMAGVDVSITIGEFDAKQSPRIRNLIIKELKQ